MSSPNFTYTQLYANVRQGYTQVYASLRKSTQVYVDLCATVRNSTPGLKISAYSCVGMAYSCVGVAYSYVVLRRLAYSGSTQIVRRKN